MTDIGAEPRIYVAIKITFLKKTPTPLPLPPKPNLHTHTQPLPQLSLFQNKPTPLSLNQKTHLAVYFLFLVLYSKIKTPSSPSSYCRNVMIESGAPCCQKSGPAWLGWRGCCCFALCQGNFLIFFGLGGSVLVGVVFFVGGFCRGGNTLL